MIREYVEIDGRRLMFERGECRGVVVVEAQECVDGEWFTLTRIEAKAVEVLGVGEVLVRVGRASL